MCTIFTLFYSTKKVERSLLRDRLFFLTHSFFYSTLIGSTIYVSLRAFTFPYMYTFSIVSSLLAPLVFSCNRRNLLLRQNFCWKDDSLLLSCFAYFLTPYTIMPLPSCSHSFLRSFYFFHSCYSGSFFFMSKWLS